MSAMAADEHLKRLLARELVAILEGDSDRLDLAEFLGVDPTRISHLRHGKLSRFSIAWLLRCLERTGHDIDVAIRVRQPPVVVRAQRSPPVTVVRYDRFEQPIRASDAAVVPKRGRADRQGLASGSE